MPPRFSASSAFPSSSRDNRVDGIAVIHVEALAAGDFQAMRIETHELHDRRVDVRDVMAIFDGVETDLVGGATDDAAFDPAARQEGGEALRMVIATGPFSAWGAAEF